MTKRLAAPWRPLRLAANTVPSFYSGNGRIAAWRGEELDPTHPEDWVASTSRRTGMGDRGLTALTGGELLADAVRGDPVGWLGSARHETGLLLKMLDAGERLPVHVHPDGEFARHHLGLANGKAEAWLVLHADPGSAVHIGFAEDVRAAQLASWVQEQDVPALLTAMNRVPVTPGDVIYCPPGVPHAIGQGVLIIEIQEPSDSSIMLEWEDFPIAEEDRFLGLDAATALGAVQTAGYGGRMTSLIGLSFAREDAPGVHPLLPAGAGEYFSADLAVAADGATTKIAPGFSVLFVLDGEGALGGEGRHDELTRGQTWLIPHGAGASELHGSVKAIVCRPAD